MDKELHGSSFQADLYRQASSSEDPFSLASVQFLLLSWVVVAVNYAGVLVVVMVKKLLGRKTDFYGKKLYPQLPAFAF